MDLGLQDKVALVTAASAGLGFATALELAREGASVVICGRDAGRVSAAVERLRSDVPEARVEGRAADVTDQGDVVDLIAFVIERFGRLDILVTNAGGPPGGVFVATSLETWRGAIDLTLMSAVYLVRSALPHLKKSPAGSVLTITSFSVKQPVPNLMLSNVIRPAVIGLTKALSQELGPLGIRTNSILPGWTKTERVDYIMQMRAESNGTSVGEEVAKVTAGIPLRRMGDPAEFGRTAAFLVSPAAGYINGTMIQVDGGAIGGLL